MPYTVFILYCAVWSVQYEVDVELQHPAVPSLLQHALASSQHQFHISTLTTKIQMALKSRKYIFDLNHVKLSFVNFFTLTCLMER